MQNGFLNRISSPAGHFTDVSRAAGALLDGAPQNISPRPPLGITLRHSRTALSSGIYPRHHRRAPSHSAPAPKKNGWQLAKPTSSRPPAFSHGITLRHHRRAFSHSIVVWHLPPASPQGILAQHCRLAFTLGITAGHPRTAPLPPQKKRLAVGKANLQPPPSITSRHSRIALSSGIYPRHHRRASSQGSVPLASSHGITPRHSRTALSSGIYPRHHRRAPSHSTPAPQKKWLVVGKANLQPPPSITAKASPSASSPRRLVPASPLSTLAQRPCPPKKMAGSWQSQPPAAP